MDFSKVDRMMEYSNHPNAIYLFGVLHVFTRRYGSGYAAMLVSPEGDHHADLLFALREDYGFDKELQTRSWFPYRQGKSSTEAIQKLLDFINNDLTDDRDELINWAVHCIEFEHYLAQSNDTNCPVPEDWILTYEEAIRK